MSEDGPRIATISFTTYSKHMNYGAVLHGWAFQRVLESFGRQSTVIDYIPRNLDGYSLKWPFLSAGQRRFVPAVRFVARWMFSIFANLRKYRKFESFLRRNLRLTTKRYRARDLKADDAFADEGFDIFVCEADVTWKKRPEAPFDRGFLLDFPAARGKVKIAYAPSLGSAPFSAAEEPVFTAAIKDFAAVSTREREGAEYVGRLLGREIPWVLDPTLLLAAADYARIARAPSVNGGYVLLYTCMRYNRNMVVEAEKYARRRGRRLVEVGNYGINRLIHRHKVIDDAGVEEWLGLFAGADAVICNSFHGICFSLIFRKPFYVFSRGAEDTRFSNICKATGLEGRLLAGDGHIPEADAPIDFDAVEDRLAPLRDRSLEFIRKEIADRVPAGRKLK